MAARGKTRRKTDQQRRNDHQHVDHAGNAIQLGAEHRDSIAEKAMVMITARHRLTRVCSRFSSRTVLPEFRLEFGVERQPRKTGLAIAGHGASPADPRLEIDRRCSSRTTLLTRACGLNELDHTLCGK